MQLWMQTNSNLKNYFFLVFDGIKCFVFNLKLINEIVNQNCHHFNMHHRFHLFFKNVFILNS